MPRAAIYFFLLALIGCERRTAAPPPPPRAAPSPGVEVTRVTPLPADRPTHLAATGSGQIFWVQEGDGARETVFSISEGGLPSATQLSNTAVLEALGKPDGRGSLQSLVSGADGNLYFYFAGRSRKQFLAAFGRFSPGTSKLQILEDGAALGQSSGMGASLALARGSILRADSLLWLWLRHDQGYALLSMDLARPGTTLRQTFEQVRTATGQLSLTTLSEDVAAGPDKSLLFVDRSEKRLWKISVLGEAAPVARLADLSESMTAPSFDGQGRLVLLASEPPAKPDEDFSSPLLNPSTGPSVAYPALVILEGDGRTILGRNAFIVPTNFNLRAFAPTRLARDRSGWLAYDPPTGELVRLRIIER
jgi:hypothetical protein